MKNYKYNWATAEIMKMYLKNSRAQEARRDRMVSEVSTGTQEALATVNNGLATVNNNAQALSQSSDGVDSDSDSSDEDE